MEEFLRAAIQEAERGLAEGGIPIGSVLVHNGQILGRGHNRRAHQSRGLLHGEMDALSASGRPPARVYRDWSLFTTPSPSSMCNGASIPHRTPRLLGGG